MCETTYKYMAASVHTYGTCIPAVATYVAVIKSLNGALD